jgi:hypothetical protein
VVCKIQTLRRYFVSDGHRSCGLCSIREFCLMALILEDQGGNRISRFGATGVNKVLNNPTKAVSDSHFNDFAMVYCEQSETFITRYGHGKVYTIVVTYWKDLESEDPVEKEFTHAQQSKAVAKFLTLCKRKPLYASI